MIQNAEIAAFFERMADLLEIEGANSFRVRAYRNAARSIAACTAPVAADPDLTHLPGIGKDLAAKIREIAETGSFRQLQELERATSPGLLELMRISGLGPKRIKKLHQELGIANRADLQTAARAGRVRELEGFGRKTEQILLKALSELRDEQPRFKLPHAEQWVADLTAWLGQVEGVADLVAAGSFRRRRETVGNLDFLVVCSDPDALMAHFTRYPQSRGTIARGPSRASIELVGGIQIDVRAIDAESRGAALHYFTGSKNHNVALRRRALQRNLKINEYGVFEGRRRVASRSEEEIFAAVGLAYIEPELREDRGEIAAAEKGALPRLIVLNDIRGDLHCHTRETDGTASLEEMAAAARERGYAYLAITEHSQRVAMARGLTPERLKAHIARIDRLNATLDGLTLLKGIEVDILEDGSLDLPNAILAELDLRICSVHYHQNLSREKQTERILRAMDNPYCNILGHPTGRLIGKRPPYEVDMPRIMQAALDRGCFLELNAHPDRLDLNDRHCRMARDLGLTLAISTDAHRTTDFDFMRCGVDQARRGWIEAADVLNTRELPELLRMLRRR